MKKALLTVLSILCVFAAYSQADQAERKELIISDVTGIDFKCIVLGSDSSYTIGFYDDREGRDPNYISSTVSKDQLKEFADALLKLGLERSMLGETSITIDSLTLNKEQQQDEYYIIVSHNTGRRRLTGGLSIVGDVARDIHTFLGI